MTGFCVAIEEDDGACSWRLLFLFPIIRIGLKMVKIPEATIGHYTVRLLLNLTIKNALGISQGENVPGPVRTKSSFIATFKARYSRTHKYIKDICKTRRGGLAAIVLHC